MTIFCWYFSAHAHCSTRCLTLDFFANIFSPSRYIVDMIEIFSKFPFHRSIIGVQYCVKYHQYSIYQQYFTDKNRNFNPYFIILFAIWTTFSHMTSLKIERTFFNLSSLSFWVFLLDKQTPNGVGLNAFHFFNNICKKFRTQNWK